MDKERMTKEFEAAFENAERSLIDLHNATKGKCAVAIDTTLNVIAKESLELAQELKGMRLKENA